MVRERHIESGEDAVQIPAARIAPFAIDPETRLMGILGNEVIPGDIAAVPPAAFDAFRALNQAEFAVQLGTVVVYGQGFRLVQQP